MISYDDVIAALPSLTADQRRNVIKAAKASGGIASDAPKDDQKKWQKKELTKEQCATLDEDWLFEGIYQCLYKRGMLTRSGGRYTLINSGGYKKYLEQREAVAEYLADVERQLPTKTRHRPVLARVFAEAMASYLESLRVFGITQMLSQIDKLPAAVEKAFPGYIASGLLSAILQLQLEG